MRDLGFAVLLALPAAAFSPSAPAPADRTGAVAAVLPAQPALALAE